MVRLSSRARRRSRLHAGRRPTHELLVAQGALHDGRAAQGHGRAGRRRSSRLDPHAVLRLPPGPGAGPRAGARGERRDRRNGPAVAAALRRPRHLAGPGRQGGDRRAGARRHRARSEGRRARHDRERRELGRAEVPPAVQGGRSPGRRPLLPSTAAAQLLDAAHDQVRALQQPRRHPGRRDRRRDPYLRRARRLPQSQSVHRSRRRAGLLRDGPPRPRVAGPPGRAAQHRAAAELVPAPSLLRQRRRQREGAPLPDRRGRRRPGGARQRLALRAVASLPGQLGAGPEDPDAGRERKGALAQSRVAAEAVGSRKAGVLMTPERFAHGMTFDDYVKFTGSPENLRREGFDIRRFSLANPRLDWSAFLRERHAKARLSEEQTAAIKWLAAQPGGPAKVLVISEDWSSDCRRDVPYLARLADAGGLELRIFTRDGDRMLRDGLPAAGAGGNTDVVLAYLNEKNGQRFATIPVAAFFTTDFVELYRYVEYPAIYRKDRVIGHLRAARPGETDEQVKTRGGRDIATLLESPFFDLWAHAGIAEILSALHERLTIRP